MRHIPLLAEEGRLRHQENAEKPQKGRRRGGQFGWPSKRAELTTPSATNRNGSMVVDVADTPPLRGGEYAAPKTLSQKPKVAALLHKSHRLIFPLNFVPFCS